MWSELWILCGLVGLLMVIRVDPIDKLTVGEVLLILACGPGLLLGVIKELFKKLFKKLFKRSFKDCLNIVLWEKPIDKQEK